METETGGQYEAYYCVKRMKTRKQETKKQVRNQQETKMKENEDTEWIQ